jgi:RNase P protein component
VRVNVLPFLSAIDLVIHARREAYEASFSQLQTDLLEAMKSLNVR